MAQRYAPRYRRRKPKRSRANREGPFEGRVQRILENAGYLVINVPMPLYGGHMFDLIAIKDQIGIPIEIKATRVTKRKLKVGGNTKTYPVRAPAYYSKEQKATQIALADKANTMYAMIEQLPQHSKMKLHFPNAELKASDMKIRNELAEVFKKWL